MRYFPSALSPWPSRDPRRSHARGTPGAGVYGGSKAGRNIGVRQLRHVAADCCPSWICGSARANEDRPLSAEVARRSRASGGAGMSARNEEPGRPGKDMELLDLIDLAIRAWIALGPP